MKKERVAEPAARGDDDPERQWLLGELDRLGFDAGLAWVAERDGELERYGRD